MIIGNASDKKLFENPGTLPDVSGAMQNYFQKMIFTQLIKTVVNFQAVETPTNTEFQGVWQPLSDQQLEMKPEGQRSWSWFMLHSEPSLILKPDDEVTYQGQNYRVMTKTDYTNYGYIEYHLSQDYNK